MESDYKTIIMATDHSWTALLDQILVHFSMDIHREAKIWYLDETTCEWNALQPKITREAEDFYMAQTIVACKTQEALAKATSKEYYNKCLAKLKKDSDAQLKHEMATYQVEKRANQQVDPKATIINNPEGRTQATPPPTRQHPINGLKPDDPPQPPIGLSGTAGKQGIHDNDLGNSSQEEPL
jgi:hypothetical protein